MYFGRRSPSFHSSLKPGSIWETRWRRFSGNSRLPPKYSKRMLAYNARWKGSCSPPKRRWVRGSLPTP